MVIILYRPQFHNYEDNKMTQRVKKCHHLNKHNNK